jgi:hypothetical protein
MDKKVTSISPRLFANALRRTRVSSRPHLSNSLLPVLRHPALSYAAEDASIHRLLDLSFQHGIAVSRLDRQIIDNLSRSKQPLQYAELLASGF